MGDERIDFSAVDPTLDQDHFDGLVDSIMARAAGELATRRVSTSPMMLLVNWKRPMLAAAAIIALVSVGVLWQVRSTQSQEESTGIAEAIGVPSLLAQSIRSNEMPSTVDLFEAFQGIQ